MQARNERRGEECVMLDLLPLVMVMAQEGKLEEEMQFSKRFQRIQRAREQTVEQVYQTDEEVLGALRSQLLQHSQALLRDIPVGIRPGKILIDTAGLLILAHRLIGLTKHIVGLVVGTIESDQLLEGCDRFFDLVCLEVVASDDRLVLGGLSFTTNAPAIAHYFTQEVHIPGFKLNSTAQIHERIIRVIYLGIDIANAP